MHHSAANPSPNRSHHSSASPACPSSLSDAHLSLSSLSLNTLPSLPLPAHSPKMSLLRSAATRAVRAPLLARAASTATPHVVSSRSNQDGALLSNIEAHWSKLPSAEQYEVFQALEEAQKKDWKQLTTDEKKAGELDWQKHKRICPVSHNAATCAIF